MKTADFTLNSLASLCIRPASTRTISAVITVTSAPEALGDAAAGDGPAVLAAPRAQGGGGRQVPTTQSSPSENLEVKWQLRLVQGLTEKQGI